MASHAQGWEAWRGHGPDVVSIRAARARLSARHPAHVPSRSDLFTHLVIFAVLCVVVVALFAWAFLYGIEQKRIDAERCNAAGMRYSMQSRSNGKFTERWSYCVDRDGFIKEIP